MSKRSNLGGMNGLLSMTVIVWLLLVSAASAQRTKLTPVPIPSATTALPTPTISPSPSLPVPQSSSIPTITSPPNKIIPPPPPPPSSTQKQIEERNNPLSAPQDIDKILKMRMNEEQWVLMYQPLSCLDISPDCVQKLQLEAVQNSPVIKELETKIQEINSHIENAKTNNKKSIDLAIFEPGLQLFLKKETVVENGQTRTVGFLDRIGQVFTNPGVVLNDLLATIGIPLLRGAYGGNDAQQSRSIQISDLTVKVAEMERGKAEIANKTKEKIQQLVLDFDTAAREFQAEQAIVRSESRSFKIYAITYAAGDGDTNIYLHRQEQLERAKLKVFKDWAKLRAQISTVKNLVISKDV
jgi:hypothetical protein